MRGPSELRSRKLEGNLRLFSCVALMNQSEKNLPSEVAQVAEVKKNE